MALHHLTPADIDALASDTQPLLSALPHRPKRLLGPRPPRPTRRTSAHRAQDRPYPVPRRLRRYVNDLRLSVTAAESGILPTTPEEYNNLFQTSFTSTWSALHQDDDARRAWHDFIQLADDEQSHFLDDRTPSQKQHVDKTLKRLIKHRGPLVTHVVRQVEDEILRNQGQVLHLNMPHALGRMVAHHVAQFHRMRHRSIDVGTERITVIHVTNPIPSSPRLVDVLVG